MTAPIAAALTPGMTSSAIGFHPQVDFIPSGPVHINLKGLVNAQVIEIVRGDNNKYWTDPTNGRMYIQLNDLAVSRQHAQILYSPADGKLIVRDHGSTNGTFVEEKPVRGREEFQLAHGKEAFALKVGHTDILITLSLRKVPDATPPHPYEALRVVPSPSPQPHPVLGREAPSAKPSEDIFFKDPGSPPGRGDLLIRFPAGTPDRTMDLVSDFVSRSTNLDRPGHPTVNLEIDWYSARAFYEEGYVKLLDLRGGRFDVKNGIVLLKGGEGRTVEMDFTAASHGIIGAIRPPDLRDRGTPVVRMILLWPEVLTPESEMGLLAQLKSAFHRVNWYLDQDGLRQLGGIFLV